MPGSFGKGAGSGTVLRREGIGPVHGQACQISVTIDGIQVYCLLVSSILLIILFHFARLYDAISAYFGIGVKKNYLRDQKNYFRDQKKLFTDQKKLFLCTSQTQAKRSTQRNYKQKDRKTERKKERETERKKERKTERKKEGQKERKKERKNEIKKETKKATARTSLELCSRHCVGIFREPGVLGCGILYLPLACPALPCPPCPALRCAALPCFVSTVTAVGNN